MSDDKFDVIVVGAGIAGSTAAYIMAKAGLSVLVIERGSHAGSKNMTGGRLYGYSLEQIMPGFAEHAPVERKITREKISLLTKDSATTLDYHAPQPDNPSHHSYSILRSSFDQWLMTQAENVGAQYICGIRVDKLIEENGQIAGIKAGDDEISADVVILAEGANALLSQPLSLGFEQTPTNLAIGVKELIELPTKQINERFNLEDGEGCAWLFAGQPTQGLSGGGFLYTNKTTLSLGIVCSLAELEKSETSIPHLLEQFKSHPTIKPLIRDGKLLEYSAHMVPEGGMNAIKALSYNGALVIGDAAGFCLNLGYTIRGMDLAIVSARAAAETVIQAKERNDFTQNTLSHYQVLLKNSELTDLLSKHKELPAFFTNKRLFNDYPNSINHFMHSLFNIHDVSSQPLRKKLIQHLKPIGFTNIIKDIFKGGRSL